jgi:hypothetical protein
MAIRKINDALELTQYLGKHHRIGWCLTGVDLTPTNGELARLN